MQQPEKGPIAKRDEKSILGPAGPDYAAALVRSTIGVIPFYGPAFAELITATIPNQRIDRLIRFVEMLAEKLKQLDRELVVSQLTDENFSDFFYETCLEAARALTGERRQYIASLVTNSISPAQADYVRSKHLLRILGEINDVEVIILRFYAVPTAGGDEEFRSRHRAIYEYEPAHTQATQDALDNAAVQGSYRQHLARLNLLAVRDWSFASTDPNYQITAFGRLLLRHIGIAPPDKNSVRSKVEILRPDPS